MTRDPAEGHKPLHQADERTDDLLDDLFDDVDDDLAFLAWILERGNL